MKYIMVFLVYLIVAYNIGQSKDFLSGWNKYTFLEAVWFGSKILLLMALCIIFITLVSAK